MNLFELMTINNYGRTKEVLFTSSLSYLLNPLCDHGLQDIFLKKFLEPLSINATKEVKVFSEHDFGKGVGNIDIYIETEENIIGIEAKIWDDSAVNNSKNNDAQLERYCNALKKISESKKEKKWVLVFLIPYKDAPICIEEFEKIIKEFGNNINLLTWIYSDEEGSQYDSFYLKQSVYEMIESILQDSTIDNSDRTSWLLKSMYNYIPNFKEQEKSKSRFPSRKDLERKCPELMNNLINPFCETLNVRINPMHTTIGFPYGTPPDKSEFGNTLFRIRTTKSYYKNIDDKEKNFPDTLGIEIWYKIYEKIKTNPNWKSWLNEIGNPNLKPEKHINEKGEGDIMLLEIEKNRKISKENVEKFNDIMKRGFEETINQK